MCGFGGWNLLRTFMERVVTALVAMSSHSLIGPIFLNKTVNSAIFAYTAEQLLATTDSI